MKTIGFPVTWETEIAAPPFSSMSALLRIMPSMPIASLSSIGEIRAVYRCCHIKCYDRRTVTGKSDSIVAAALSTTCISTELIVISRRYSIGFI